MKYQKICAVVCLFCLAAFSGCSPNEPEKRPLQSFPIVVASDPASSSGATGHSHNCNDPDTLCGTLTDNLFQDSQQTFRLPVPQGFAIREQELSQDSMILGSSSDHASIEIRRQERDPNLLAYTKEEFQNVYQVDVTGFQMLSFEQISIADCPAVHLVYSCVDGGVSYHFYQYILAGDFDYNITLIRRSDEADLSADFATCVQAFQQISPKSDPKSKFGKLVGNLYTAPDGSYTISLPDGWRLDPTAEHMTAESADHSSAVNILVGEPDSTLTDASREQIQASYQKRFSSAELSVFEKITLSGRPALHLVCTYQAENKQVCAEQYLVSSPQHSYVITFTKAAAAPDPAFAQSAQTLRVT